MTARKVSVKMRKYPLICRAVEEGCNYAKYRFSKHLDGDTKIEDLDIEALAGCFEDAIMNALCEVIDFEDE